MLACPVLTLTAVCTWSFCCPRYVCGVGVGVHAFMFVRVWVCVGVHGLVHSVFLCVCVCVCSCNDKGSM